MRADPQPLDELTTVLRAQLMPTWSLMWRTLDLLRALPVGARVTSRWDADRDTYSAFVQHLADGGLPQPRRDGAVAAAARLHRLENAATRYAVQRAFDDPLVMAEYRLTGAAFVGVVTLAAPDRVDDTGKRPVLRPRIMVAAAEPVRVEPGASLTSPARPSQKAKVISITGRRSAAGTLRRDGPQAGGRARQCAGGGGAAPADDAERGVPAGRIVPRSVGDAMDPRRPTPPPLVGTWSRWLSEGMREPRRLVRSSGPLPC